MAGTVCVWLSHFQNRSSNGGIAAVAALLWLLLCSTASAQTTVQWWPEFDGFIKVNERSRFYLNYSSERDLDETSGQLQNVTLGSHFDLTFKPVFSRRLARKADWKRQQYLWARIGYEFQTNPAKNSTLNHVGVVELTVRLPLPKEIWAEQRARVDLRDLNGAYSTRYRYRLQIQQNRQAFGVQTIPFINAEAYYDTRVDTVSRERYEAGMQVVLNRQWRLKPYYVRQRDLNQQPQVTNAIALTLVYYR